MQDRFETAGPGLDSPAAHAFAIVPSDSAELSEATRALYIGGAGSLNVMLLSGATVSLSGVAGGSLLPLRLRQVLASGTTATGLVGLS